MPRPLRLPVECWQPIQGGTERALDFMAKHGIQGMVGGGSAEGGAMHKVVLDLAGGARAARPAPRARRAAVLRLPLLHRRQPRAGRRARPRKYYEENMKMFGQLRLVRGADRRADRRSCATRSGRPTARLPRIEDAIEAGGVLCGSPDADRRAPEEAGGSAIRGSTAISVSLSVGVPKAVALEQLERFATEVMPAFKSAKAAQPALAK